MHRSTNTQKSWKVAFCLPCMLISFRVYKLQYISFMVFKNAGKKFKQSDQINIEKYTPLPSHKKVTRWKLLLGVMSQCKELRQWMLIMSFSMNFEFFSIQKLIISSFRAKNCPRFWECLCYELGTRSFDGIQGHLTIQLNFSVNWTLSSLRGHF